MSEFKTLYEDISYRYLTEILGVDRYELKKWYDDESIIPNDKLDKITSILLMKLNTSSEELNSYLLMWDRKYFINGLYKSLHDVLSAEDFNIQDFNKLLISLKPSVERCIKSRSIMLNTSSMNERAPQLNYVDNIIED